MLSNNRHGGWRWRFWASTPRQARGVAVFRGGGVAAPWRKFYVFGLFIWIFFLGYCPTSSSHCAAALLLPHTPSKKKNTALLLPLRRAAPATSSNARDFVQFSTAGEVDPLLDSVKWDDKGLAVAIAQNVDTGAVLMQGFINRDALSQTISSRKATFYSRSRSTLWTKGETSMNFINVSDIFLDCDRDSIIYLGKPDGPTCHTGADTCYYTSVDEVMNDPLVDGNKLALTTLYSLESTISKRNEEFSKDLDSKPSWTKRLLLDDTLLCSKIREEADELCRTLEENEDQTRTASEMADVLYHAMVLLARKGVKVEDVLQVLRLRFAQSGIDEKTSRKS